MDAAQHAKVENADIRTQLADAEQLLTSMNLSWEDKLVQTRQELERVAEEAKARAAEAERRSVNLKRELNVQRHEGR